MQTSKTRGEKNGWGIVVIGVMLLIVSSFLALYSTSWRHTATKTTGTVVSNRVEKRNIRGGEQKYYTATVEYNSNDGVTRTFETDLGGTEPIAIGEVLPVLISSDDPEIAEVGGLDYWGPAVGCAALGAFFMFWGVILILGARWLDRLGVPMRR